MFFNWCPDKAIALVIYEDGSRERFFACIQTSAEIAYLTSMIPNDKRAGEWNRLHAEHLKKLPIKDIVLEATYEVEFDFNE